MFKIEVTEFQSAKYLTENDMVRMCVYDESRGYKFVSWVGEVEIARKAYLRRQANQFIKEQA